MPPRGYWARKAAGQRVVRPPLIEFPAMDREPTISFSLPSPESVSATEDGGKPVNPYAEMYAKQIEAIGPLNVAQKLSTHPHPIIARWLEEDRRNRELSRSAIGYGYHPIRYDTQLERRKLRILDVILKTLEAMGLKAEVDKHHYSAISVSVKYDSVQFSITEHVRQFRRQLTPEEKAKHWNPNATWTQEKEETGKFVVKITAGTPRSVPSVFKEDDEPIEQSLHKFVAALVVALAQVREYREKREAEERRRREDEERARQLEKQRQAEIARKTALRGQAASWREAALLREYVAAVRVAAARGRNVVPADRLEEWAAWALEHADEIDPITSASIRSQD